MVFSIFATCTLRIENSLEAGQSNSLPGSNVTETYLNLENVKIERKKTGHKAACMSPGKWEVGRKLSQRCITWLV